MDTLKKTLAFLCASTFVLTALVSLMLFNLDRSGFTAETYKTALAKDEFYNNLPAVLAESMSSIDQSQFPFVMRTLSTQAWTDFFRTLLPADALKTIGDGLLDSSFAYLNRQTDSVQISLIPLKTSMVSDTGVQAVFTLLNTQPDCTFMEIAQMSIDLLTTGDMKFCKPPSELYPIITPIIQGQLQIVTGLIPDQLTVLQAPLQNDPRQRLQTARLFMRLSPILPLAFLLLTTLLIVRSLQTWLNWWGASFVATGLLAGLTAISGAPIFGAILQRLLILRMSAYLPGVLLKYGSELAAAMIQALLRPVMWQGMAMTLIGLGMALAGYLVKSNLERA